MLLSGSSSLNSPLYLLTNTFGAAAPRSSLILERRTFLFAPTRRTEDKRREATAFKNKSFENLSESEKGNFSLEGRPDNGGKPREKVPLTNGHFRMFNPWKQNRFTCEKFSESLRSLILTNKVLFLFFYPKCSG